MTISSKIRDDVLVLDRHPNSNELPREGICAQLSDILSELHRALEQHPHDAQAAALRLIKLLTSRTPSSKRGGLAPWQQRKLERYLRDNLEHPLPISDLAGQIPLSRSHFCRAFKQTYGVTAHSYVTRLRVELAQRLMLSTSDPLSQIALECGLADQAHLSKLFRRFVGETPTDWRRMNMTEAQAEAQRRRAA